LSTFLDHCLVRVYPLAHVVCFARGGIFDVLENDVFVSLKDLRLMCVKDFDSTDSLFFEGNCFRGQVRAMSSVAVPFIPQFEPMSRDDGAHNFCPLGA
jgi:hypothetical protein